MSWFAFFYGAGGYLLALIFFGLGLKACSQCGKDIESLKGDIAVYKRVIELHGLKITEGIEND